MQIQLEWDEPIDFLGRLPASNVVKCCTTGLSIDTGAPTAADNPTTTTAVMTNTPVTSTRAAGAGTGGPQQWQCPRQPQHALTV